MKWCQLSKRLLLLGLIFIADMAGAWVFYEHRHIGVLAIRDLSPYQHAVLQNLWSDARKGHESRLTDSVVESHQGLNPDRIDYATWFGLAGDHSCSPGQLLNTVLESDWVLKVAAVSAHLEKNIKDAKSESAQINYLHESDIQFQRVDPEYATRAGSNNVHFLLARPNVSTDVTAYLTACLTKDTPVNAIGAYVSYHLDAVWKASRYATENLTAEEKSKLALSIFADEAFAIHFLEDAFAAGHIAGIWGTAAVRKGTHDYYNGQGLEVVTWNGKHMVLMGDAFMRPEDAEIASATIRLSLQELLDAVTGKLKMDTVRDSQKERAFSDTINSCTTNFNGLRETNARFFVEVLLQTPVPGLATGRGAMPRFRSELGKFVGFSSALDGYSVFGGFGQTQMQQGAVGGLEMNVRYGFGLEGVLDKAADGLVWLQAGWRLDGSSTSQVNFNNAGGLVPSGNLTAAIPGRSAFDLRLRLPYWLIPGDMIIAAPILLIFAKDELTKMGVVAANGGLLHTQTVLATSVGQFQFVLGREVGVYFYGMGKTKDELFIPVSTGAADSSSIALVSYHSTRWDFPIIEYVPSRTFSYDQASGILIQIFGGFDVPHGYSMVLPVSGGQLPPLKTVWNLGLRLVFNWRHYL